MAVPIRNVQENSASVGPWGNSGGDVGVRRVLRRTFLVELQQSDPFGKVCGFKSHLRQYSLVIRLGEIAASSAAIAPSSICGKTWV